MRILKIGIKNLHSLRTQKELDFLESPLKDTGLFAIVGDTGAGKTTILDAITLSLYGKVAREVAPEEVLSFGSVEAFAEVTFLAGADKYLARWSIRRARGKMEGKVQLPERELSLWNPALQQWEILAEKVTDVNRKVEEITGLDYVRFTKSVLLSQGDFAAFLKSREQERSDLLERITGTEIYTLLSKAAHEKQRLEKATLEDLELRRQTLSLLDKDSLKNLKKAIKSLQEKSSIQKKDIAILRTKIQQLKDLEKLTLRKQALENQRESLKRLEKGLEGDLERLQIHEKLIPFKNLMEKSGQLQSSIAELKASKKMQEEKIRFLELEKLHLEKEKVEKSAALEKGKKDYKHLESILEKVIELDKDIQNASEKLEGLNSQLTKAKLSFEDNNQAISATDVHLKAWEQSLLESRKWMEQNAHAIAHQGEISAIIQSIEELNRKGQELSRIQDAIAAENKLLQHAESEHLRAEKKWIDSVEALNLLLQQFEDAAPNLPRGERNLYLSLLGRELDEGTDKLQKFRKIEDLLVSYHHALREFDEKQQMLSDLQSEEIGLNRELLTSLELMDEAQSKANLKRKQFEQQKAIFQFQEARQKLQPGDPCPVCFSRDHQISGHLEQIQTENTLVEMAEKEWKKAEKSFQLLYQKHLELIHSQTELSLQIEALAGKRHPGASIPLQLEFEKLLAAETQLATHFRNFPNLKENQLKLPQFSEIVSHFDSAQKSKRSQKDHLEKLNLSIEKAEMVVADHHQIVAAKSSQLLRTQDKLSAQIQQKEKLTHEISQRQKALENKLTNLKMPSRLGNPDELIEDLKTLNRNIGNFDAKRREIDQRIAVLSENRKIQLQNKTELEKNLEEILKLKEIQTKKLESLRQARADLFGLKDPKNEKANFQKFLGETDASLNRILQALSETTPNLASEKSTWNQIHKSLEKYEETYDQHEKLMEEKMRESGIQSKKFIEENLLTEEITHEIHQKRESLKIRQIELAQSFVDLKNEWSKLGPVTMALDQLENQERALEKAERMLQHDLQELGSEKMRLEHHKNQQKIWKDLMKQIALQKTEWERWAKLNELIGSHDGKRFRIFAQSLTLEKLTALANTHLQRLNGRYLIRKRNFENLELEIMDTYQADNIRSMNSLSGGETFLVSLALALGLSDLAGRKAQISSLFIDEGFGTLDETMLDIVISTLENLQTEGKTIGIISHVPALKERLNTQIRVVRKGNGFSEVEVWPK